MVWAKRELTFSCQPEAQICKCSFSATIVLTIFLPSRSQFLQLPPRSILHSEMVIPPPVRPLRIKEFLKPYVLKMHFTNKYVNAQVVHASTASVASSASSQEKALRSSMESTRDVAAAAKIGRIIGERLLQKEIPAVSVLLQREQKCHGKVKAVIDSLREVGIKLV